MEYLLQKLKADNLIDETTYNGKKLYWRKFRRTPTAISQLLYQVFPKTAGRQLTKGRDSQ